MSLISDAEAAVATGGWSLYLKMAWKALPWALFAAAMTALFITRGTLHDERQAAIVKEEQAKSELAAEKAASATRLQQAAENYAGSIAARQPLLVRSTDTVREYAQTPAGRALCATPDRVRDIDALDAALFPGNAGSAERAMPTDGRASPAGRVGK